MPLAALGPILIGAAGTSAAATAGAWGAIGAGTKIAGDLAGAHTQAGAAKTAAQLQADGQAKALQFEQQQAAQTQANFEATQKANYDQYAAREGRLSTLGQLVGLPARQTPAYVPTTSASAPQGQALPMSGPTTAGAMTGAQPGTSGQTVASTPQIGQRKTFPNGAVGMWDGKGWVAQ